MDVFGIGLSLDVLLRVNRQLKGHVAPVCGDGALCLNGFQPLSAGRTLDADAVELFQLFWHLLEQRLTLGHQRVADVELVEIQAPHGLLVKLLDAA